GRSRPGGGGGGRCPGRCRPRGTPSSSVRSTVRPEPRLSVVFCPHNRPADLARCLDALGALEDPVEVVVVDSASEPPVTVSTMRGEAGPQAIVHVRENRRGLSLARDRGLAAATAPIVAFVDDDAAPEPD